MLDQFTLQIISTATIGAVLVLYVAFLNKLRPSEDTPSNMHKSSGGNESDSPERPATLEAAEPKEETLEVTTSTQQETGDDMIEIEVDAAEAENAKGKKREKASKKAFFLFGKGDFETCKHKFGHLKTLPKNTPIPDECFGCPQILECLMPKKSK